jgi:hypothetical protein
MHADGRVYFHCPGCDSTHVIVVDGTRGWTWNGSAEKPTFSPSVLVNYPGNADAVLPEWKNDRVCHSFVTDGKIQFLSDCTHSLANTTVEIPPWD